MLGLQAQCTTSPAPRLEYYSVQKKNEALTAPTAQCTHRTSHSVTEARCRRPQTMRLCSCNIPNKGTSPGRKQTRSRLEKEGQHRDHSLELNVLDWMSQLSAQLPDFPASELQAARPSLGNWDRQAKAWEANGYPSALHRSRISRRGQPCILGQHHLWSVHHLQTTADSPDGCMDRQ